MIKILIIFWLTNNGGNKLDHIKDNNKVISSTLANGLKVLETIAEIEKKNKGVTLQEVTKAMGIHRSNVYRYLRTLVDCGWLEVDPETFRYSIGGKPLQFAGFKLSQLELRTIARPFLEKLAVELSMTTHLAVLYDDSVVYIDKVESNSPIQMRSRVGMSMPSYSTGIGKAMLAFSNRQWVSELLEGKLFRRTPNTLSTLEDLLTNLEAAYKCGYALDMEENEEGIGCVAAPIFGFDNTVIGAISVSTLIQNMTPDNISNFGIRVKHTAICISKRMGCPNNIGK